MSSDCNPLYFTLAWFVSISVLYAHVGLLLLTLVFGSPLLIRFHLGQVFNLMVGFVLYLFFGTYFSFECGLEPFGAKVPVVSNADRIYVNLLPFPAIDVQILCFTLIFFSITYHRGEWRLETVNKHIYYRFISVMILFSVILCVSFLWFHSLIQIFISILTGVVLGLLWYKFVNTFFRYMPVFNSYPTHPNLISTPRDSNDLETADNNLRHEQ